MLVAIGDSYSRAWQDRWRSSFLICNKALTVYKTRRTTVPRVIIIELVFYVLYEGCLVVNGQYRVCGNIDPVLCP